jgi:hypothetical protein
VGSGSSSLRTDSKCATRAPRNYSEARRGHNVARHTSIHARDALSRMGPGGVQQVNRGLRYAGQGIIYHPYEHIESLVIRRVTMTPVAIG